MRDEELFELKLAVVNVEVHKGETKNRKSNRRKSANREATLRASCGKAFRFLMNTVSIRRGNARSIFQTMVR